MSLIETSNLSKTYAGDGDETPALQGVNLSVSSGEFVAIMGPSGSGKSTLLHLLGLLDSSTSGTYFFDKRNAKEFNDLELAGIRNKKMGFVFQAFNLMPRATVLENVMLPLFYSGIPESEWKDRALCAIESVGLSHRISHESNKLSGGEKQRAAIARALVCDPVVIFADEPTGNLDSRSGGQVMEVLTRLNEKENRTIVLITHETYTAEHAGRIIHIKDGMIEREEIVGNRKKAEGFVK